MRQDAGRLSSAPTKPVAGDGQRNTVPRFASGYLSDSWPRATRAGSTLTNEVFLLSGTTILTFGRLSTDALMP